MAGRDAGAERGLSGQAAASRLVVAGGMGCRFQGSNGLLPHKAALAVGLLRMGIAVVVTVRGLFYALHGAKRAVCVSTRYIACTMDGIPAGGFERGSVISKVICLLDRVLHKQRP